MNLITAAQAAKIAETNNKTQINMLNYRIEEAAKKGLNYVTIFDNLSQETKDLLKKAGYEISAIFNGYDSKMTIIRW